MLRLKCASFLQERKVRLYFTFNNMALTVHNILNIHVYPSCHDLIDMCVHKQLCRGNNWTKRQPCAQMLIFILQPQATIKV